MTIGVDVGGNTTEVGASSTQTRAREEVKGERPGRERPMGGRDKQTGGRLAGCFIQTNVMRDSEEILENSLITRKYMRMCRIIISE